MTKRIDLDDTALMFHNKGEYAGFECWEMDHIYQHFIALRVQEFRRDFVYLMDCLIEKGTTLEEGEYKKFHYLSEWAIREVGKSSKHKNPESLDRPTYSYCLRAQRSSMTVEYEVKTDWPKEKFFIKRWDYIRPEEKCIFEWVLVDEFELPFRPCLEINLTHYQRLSLFSNWFYYLYQEFLQNKEEV